jgi:hypothetical protein
LQRLRSPLFEIHCGMLGFTMSNMKDLGKVCRLVGRIITPDLDLSTQRFPNFEQVRQYIIKLDLLHSLSRRRLFDDSTIKVFRYISPDSSPQGMYDFLCCTEELLIRTVPFVMPDPFDAFKGFRWELRSLPCTTIARQESSTMVKTSRLAHVAVLESGPEHLWDWRISVLGFLSDQGTERGIRSAPFGAKEEVDAALGALRAGLLHTFEPEAKNIVFLPNALDQAGIFHVLFNAVEEAFTEIDAWKLYVDRAPNC